MVRLIATRSGDAERGPAVFMHPDDAKYRLLADGELAWVQGPWRQELARVRVDEGLGPGDVAVRDVLAASPSELVRVVKPDLDTRRRGAPA